MCYFAFSYCSFFIFLIHFFLHLFAFILFFFFFFFNVTATTEIYTDRHTLSLHDALPICSGISSSGGPLGRIRWSGPRECQAGSGPETFPGWSPVGRARRPFRSPAPRPRWLPAATAAARSRSNSARSEEHTSELQSLMRTSYAVFCLKKKKDTN